MSRIMRSKSPSVTFASASSPSEQLTTSRMSLPSSRKKAQTLSRSSCISSTIRILYGIFLPPRPYLTSELCQNYVIISGFVKVLLWCVRPMLFALPKRRPCQCFLPCRSGVFTFWGTFFANSVSHFVNITPDSRLGTRFSAFSCPVSSPRLSGNT